MAIDPNTPATIYAGFTGSGIYKTTNSGDTWTAAAPQPGNTKITALAFKNGDSSKLFAATNGGGVFYNSDSNGLVWADCTNIGLTNNNVISLISDATGKLHAGTQNAGIFVSTDNCTTWTDMDNGLPN